MVKFQEVGQSSNAVSFTCFFLKISSSRIILNNAKGDIEVSG